MESVEEFVRKTGGSLAQMEAALVGFTRAQAPPMYTAGPGAVTGALGARKALTPAAHASATISRAIIAAEGSTRCYKSSVTRGCD